jgi:hypothetical protein
MRFPVVEVEYRLCASRVWEKLVAEPWRAKFRNTIAEPIALDVRHAPIKLRSDIVHARAVTDGSRHLHHFDVVQLSDPSADLVSCITSYMRQLHLLNLSHSDFISCAQTAEQRWQSMHRFTMTLVHDLPRLV